MWNYLRFDFLICEIDPPQAIKSTLVFLDGLYTQSGKELFYGMAKSHTGVNKNSGGSGDCCPRIEMQNPTESLPRFGRNFPGHFLSDVSPEFSKSNTKRNFFTGHTFCCGNCYGHFVSIQRDVAGREAGKDCHVV